jgi:5-methyltetrahydrofolate--homocysteine methyltransferase
MSLTRNSTFEPRPDDEGPATSTEPTTPAAARAKTVTRSDVLSTLLAEKEFLIADGAVGTNMMIAGLGPGEPPDFWNTENPEPVEALHRSFVDAGSDIILTNTFGSNPPRLSLDGAEARCLDLNVTGARLARAAAAAVDRPVVVAGSIGPTGELMEPFGAMTVDEAYKAYAEQAEALAEGGVDVIWIETIFIFDELGAAIRAGQSTGLPVAATMTFDTNRRTMMGDTPEAAMEYVLGLPDPPLAFGANCGAGPSMLIDSVCVLKRAANPDTVIIAKGNCGVPEMTAEGIVFSGTVEVMETYARMACDAGARIVGGCCGTTAATLKAIAEAIKDYQPGEAPDAEAIEAALGPMKGPRVADTL